MKFPDGREPKRLPNRNNSPESREDRISFLNAERYREDYRSVSRSMVRDPEEQYSASSSALRDDHEANTPQRPTSSNNSFNEANSFREDPNSKNSPPPREHRRDPSLIFGPNPSVTRDFAEEFEKLEEESEEEEEDNYSSILKEMGRLETDTNTETDSYSDAENSETDEKEDEVDERKTYFQTYWPPRKMIEK